MAQTQEPSPIFSAQAILAYANTLLAGPGSRLRVTTIAEQGHNYIAFDAPNPRSGTTRVVAPFCEPRPGFLFFRSLLKVNDPRRGGNGQASRGTKEIRFFGEDGLWLVADRASLERHFRSVGSGIPEDRRAAFDQFVEERIARAQSCGQFTDRIEIMDRGTDGDRRPLEQP